MTEPQVTSFLKDNLGPCGCGCGLEGVLRVKPWRSGVRCVKHGCKCPSCRGKRSTKKGDRKGTKVRQALNLGGPRTRHEELWTGSLRVEVKAGAQVGPILTRYLKAKQQSEAARPIGDNRPFVFAAAPDRGPILLVLELDKVEDVAFAIAEGLAP